MVSSKLYPLALLMSLWGPGPATHAPSTPPDDVCPIQAVVPQPAPAEAWLGPVLTSESLEELFQAPEVEPVFPVKGVEGLGDEVVAHARELLGLKSLKAVDSTIPDDCSGLVRIAFERAGVMLLDANAFSPPGVNAVTLIHEELRRQGAVHWGHPHPGDLVFFRETYDRNGDGKRNDGLTHIGIVEGTEPDGTVVFIHRAKQGVIRGRLNVVYPGQHRDPASGTVLNEYLRRARATGAAQLTGELFAGFASPVRVLASAP